MKILQIPRRFVRSNWGGTESVILETSCRLLQMGHQTEVLCPNILSNQASEHIQGIDVERTSYFYPYWGLNKTAREQMDLKAGNLFSFDLMRRLKQSAGLDLIHLHTGKRLGGIARRVARQRGIPYVISLHGGVHDVPQEEKESWTEPTCNAWEWGKLLGWWVGSRRVLDDAAAILCVGKAEYEKTQIAFPHKRVVHLPNGVDCDRFRRGDGDAFRKRHNLPTDARVMLVVGRIDPQKNQLAAIEMLPQLIASHPHAHLVILGHVTNPAYCDRLTNAVLQLNLQKHVRIVPGVDPASQELVDAYHAADLFLLPSIHEPFGIVILEAWAAGVPVVASAVGGVSALVNDRSNGLLFPSGDQAKALACVASLLGNQDLRSRLVRSAQVTAEARYDWKQITEKLAGLYEELVH